MSVSPMKWASGRLEGAVHLPLSDYKGAKALWNEWLAQQEKGTTLLLYYAAGARFAMRWSTS